MSNQNAHVAINEFNQQTCLPISRGHHECCYNGKWTAKQK